MTSNSPTFFFVFFADESHLDMPNDRKSPARGKSNGLKIANGESHTKVSHFNKVYCIKIWDNGSMCQKRIKIA